MKNIKIITSLIVAGFIFTQVSAQENQRPERPDPLQLTETMFNEFDINEDGAFGPDELTTALTYMKSQRPQRNRLQIEDREGKGPTVSDRAMAMYNKYDANKDGLLQAEEFLNAMESRERPIRLASR